MAKKIQNKQLGMALLAGLIIQFVLPQIKLSGLSWIATLIYLVVAVYLLIA